MLCRFNGGDGATRINGYVERCAEARANFAGERQRGLRIHRVDADHLEQVPQTRLHLEQARQRGWLSFRPKHHLPGGNRRHHLFEDACALSLMRAASRELQDIGYVPNEFLADGDLSDRAAYALLQLTEPLLARHQLGAAGLDDLPTFVRKPLRKQAQQRGLSGLRLADDDQRTRRLPAGDFQRAVDDGAPVVRHYGERGKGPGVPDIANRIEESVVDMRALGFGYFRKERRGERVLQGFQQRLRAGDFFR